MGAPRASATSLNYKRSTLLVLLLMQVLASEFKAVSAIEPSGVRTVTATPFISARRSKFGLGMEGVAVDQVGNVYAVGFSGDGTSGIGSLANARAQVEQNLLFKDQTATSSFNGLRFLPLSPSLSENFILRGLAADVKTHQVTHLLTSKRDGRTRGSLFCNKNEKNETMKQPNDIAVAPRLGVIYMSGGDYGQVRTRVGDGDLWMCKAKNSFYRTVRDNSELGPVEAKKLGDFGLTNGVEVSPDEKTLYLTESFHDLAEPKTNVIWKFDIDQETGEVGNRTLLVDFEKLDGSGHVDLDGIRCDSEGNLFVTKNGREGEAVKISPTGQLLLRIELPGVFEVTNLDFGGPDGKFLFVSGKCRANPDKGCVDVWYGNPAPGRAWSELTASTK